MSLQSHIAVSLSLLLGAACLPQAHAQAVSSPIVVQLKDGTTVTKDELQQYMQIRVDLRQAATSAAGVEGIVRDVGMTLALVEEGKALGVERKPQEGEERPPKIDDTYGLAVYKRLAPACERPRDEAATRQYYDQHPAAFTVPPQIRLSRIMFPRTQKVEEQPAVGWMLEKVQAIGRHEVTFEALAQQAQKVYNLDPQGDLGWVLMPGENEIMRAIASAQPGDMVGPVPEGNFVYLFQIGDKREGRLLTWDEVKASAAQRAVQYCAEEGRKKIRGDLFEKYGVTVNTQAIRDMFDPSKASR